jgi:D-alanine-D-alanine ligase
MMNKSEVLRVAIACNIKTDRASDAEAEFDEPETIEAISAALRQGGFETVVLEATAGFPQKLEAAKPDIVFNIAEGRTGRNREAQIPAILEYYDVPYTGSDAAALSVSLDKAMAKRLAQSRGIQTPRFRIITIESSEMTCDLPFPVIIKPNAEGSSKGIPDDCVAEDVSGLHRLVGQMRSNYDGDLMAEQYVDGREFTVGIIGNGPDIRIFEPMEVVYRKLRGAYKVYSYEVKKNYRDYISYKCPPDLSEELIASMKRDAEIVYKTLGCLDFARVDFRLSKDEDVFFLEANPLPGLAPGYSDFPMLANFNGIEYERLICEMLGCALKRYGMCAP